MFLRWLMKFARNVQRFVLFIGGCNNYCCYVPHSTDAAGAFNYYGYNRCYYY